MLAHRPFVVVVVGVLPACLFADEPPSFVNDVQPVLTRFGCNMGACHGKLAGQNGFKLSLRAYAPEQDFAALTRDEGNRRISRVAPEDSLLLTKPAGKTPHAGGKLLATDSRAYQTLLAWIKAGAPGPKADEPRTVRLELSVGQQALALGQTQPLTAWAIYSDDSKRDVTWLTKFESNDGGTHSVSPDGVVKAERQGETAVRAAFDGFVTTASFTTAFDANVPAEAYAARHNVLDEHIFTKLAALKIEPSPLCDDATFLRRSTLDTIGTLPTPEETRAFLADTAADKRAKWIESLLNRPEFVDYWTLQLSDLLQNRKERDHDVRGAKGVRNFHAWLRQQVAANKSWKDIAGQVLTATGDTTQNPAVGYYVVTVGEKNPEQSEVADSVAQAFLGTRINCARCHNHPLERFTQDDYYHFVAFFSRVTLDRKNPQDGATVLMIGTEHTRNLKRQIAQEEKKLEELKSQNAEEAKLTEQQKKLEGLHKQITDSLNQPVNAGQPRTGKRMAPQPIDRSPVEVAPGGDPRAKLVEWMQRGDNETFAGSMVNRLWKHFFAVGLVEPVDDLRATNPPSNKPLWDALVKEFIANNYDLKATMRLILNSRAYQTSAETRPGNVRDQKFYSHYYPRRLQAEVLLDAICAATGAVENFPGYPQGVRAIQLPGPNTDSYFLATFGRSDRVTACACERNGEVSLPQLLHLQNGESIPQKIAAGDGRLMKLLEAESDNGQVIERLYLTALGRLPTDAEKNQAAEFVAGADRKLAFQDAFWALLNTKEFSFNH